eukprot:3989136-Amphidinium_carterae.1
MNSGNSSAAVLCIEQRQKTMSATSEIEVPKRNNVPLSGWFRINKKARLCSLGGGGGDTDDCTL